MKELPCPPIDENLFVYPDGRLILKTPEEIQAEFDLIMNEEKRQLSLKVKISNELYYYWDVLRGISPNSRIYKFKRWLRNREVAWHDFKNHRLDIFRPSEMKQMAKYVGYKKAILWGIKNIFGHDNGCGRSIPQQVITHKNTNEFVKYPISNSHKEDTKTDNLLRSK